MMLAALGVALLSLAPVAQAEFGVTEISDYRLESAVFTKFDHASRLIAAATRADVRFEREPLFTKDILLSGDVLPMAAALEARLRNEPAFAAAFFAADFTPREYTKFVIALVGARFAYGFVKSGVIRSVPAGVHADNVMFVDAHLADIDAAMKALGID
jgi:hypothetical protein